ncbi:MAG TPA: phosphate ABC transporter permease subunit PstC [Mariprofundaceae bacterium]|nr:phosphate ABC transporter permease subunit PstC [Mariprofundaceae bacterium]
MSTMQNSAMEAEFEAMTTTIRPKPARDYSDNIFKGLTWLFATGLALLFISILYVLWQESQPAVHKFGFGFLTSTDWNPVTEKFGAMIAIVGTLVSTLIAMLIAIPLSIGIALYLSEIAPHWLRTPVGTAIELLAAIPSIVYGMWGLFVVAPLMSEHVQPWLQNHFGFLPFFSGPSMGIGMLTAGLVLALMIIPFISSVTRDIFLMTPQPLKEAAYGLGCTTWEVVRDVVIPYGKKGVVGAVFLGLGRALGETMAVTFVIGNAYHLSWSLFAPGNSIASTLANEFTEADGDVYLASLIELGLVLFVITFIILGAAQLWLRAGNRQKGG